MRLNC